jgi:hypothetical protein
MRSPQGLAKDKSISTFAMQNPHKKKSELVNTYIGYYTKEWLLDILNGDKLNKLENKFREYEK